MTWYSTQDEQGFPIEERSLVIAFSNLLQRFDQDLAPNRVYNIMASDDTNIDWWSLPRNFDGFKLCEFAETESWPTTNNAIICQRIMDESIGGIVEHYSLVADQRAHSIIDSKDGTIKNANVYGPVVSWSSYSYEGEEVEPQAKVVDENIYVLKEGENVWDVARNKNIPVASLIAENDLEDPVHVPAGTELYIPTRQSNKDEAEVTYDIYEKPVPMHVIRSEGAKKWSYGGIKKWEDLYSTGRLYPQGHNLWIVAVANVPVGEMTAGYYMDTVSFGDYLKTGRVRYTTGFNWQHLGDGHTKEGTLPVPVSTVAQVVADAMLEEDRPALLPEPETPVIAPETAVETEEEVPILQVTHAPTWKDSFEFLNDEKQPIEYMFNEAYDVTELEGKLPSKHVSRNDIVRIIGTFEKDGIEYARPAVKGYWYGVPTALLTLEETVYDTDIDLPTRIALRGHLSRSEKRLVAMAKAVGNYRKLTSFVRKK